MVNTPDREAIASQMAGLMKGTVQDFTAGPELVEVTNAWAVGLWKVEGDQLRLLGFGSAPRFDPAVAEEFVEATLSVPLEKTELGIVNAIVHDRPALARATELTGDLKQSAGWLGRFQARCSLSCPIRNSDGKAEGVLAVSWVELYEESDPVPQGLLQLADLIAARL